MTTPKPMATHTLRNGWTVLEVESTKNSVFIGENCLSSGDTQGRYHFHLLRAPSLNEVKVVHLIGSTPEEHAFALKIAMAVASNRGPRDLPWDRRRMANGRNWYFYVILGKPIREAEEFERLRRGLHTDDSIELEFRSIVQQLEGTKA